MAGKPIATMGSMHVCPMVSGTVPHVGGPLSGPGAPNVLINGKPAALMGDICVCVGPPDTVAQGEPTVLINGTPVVTQGCLTAHGGTITAGEPTVMVGPAQPGPKATLALKEIPFPKVDIFDHLGALVRGKSGDLKEAKANQEQLKKEAEEKTGEPKVYNLQWRNGETVTRNSKVLRTVTLTASVMNIDEGENFNLNIKRGAVQSLLNESEGGDSESQKVESVQVTVKDKMISHTWNIEETTTEK